MFHGIIPGFIKMIPIHMKKGRWVETAAYSPPTRGEIRLFLFQRLLVLTLLGPTADLGGEGYGIIDAPKNQADVEEKPAQRQFGLRLFALEVFEPVHVFSHVKLLSGLFLFLGPDVR
jgi:hypothetical protein